MEGMEGGGVARGGVLAELGKTLLAVTALSLALAAVVAVPDLAEEAGLSKAVGGLWSDCGWRREAPIPDLGKAAWCAVGGLFGQEGRSSSGAQGGDVGLSLGLPERR